MKSYDGNIIFEQRPTVASYASVVGKKEGEGPLRDHFDRIIRDSYAGKDTFEQAESRLMSTAVQTALDKGRYSPAYIDLACCGDLLNQCIASSFAMRRFGIPYAGVYGACSTMALSMITAAVAVEGGAARRAVCAASSHYCTAERQYRFPLEYGSQRPPTAQWTVTGAGACVIERGGPTENRREDSGMFTAGVKTEIDENGTSSGRSAPMSSSRTECKAQPGQNDKGADNNGKCADNNGKCADQKGKGADQNDKCTDNNSKCADVPVPVISAARIGRIIDYSITDQNNMGAAMAPAVVKLGT